MRAYLSPIRLFAFGIIGLILIVASVDVMFTHWLSTPPENNDGVLTTRGHAQQRGDIIWGAVMIGTGVLLVGGAVVELVRRRPQATVRSAGMVLAIGSHETEVTVPWENVRGVRSDMSLDPFDGSLRECLVIEVIDRAGLPEQPMGAEWDGAELRVDADAWTKDVTEVTLSAQGALDHYRRVAAIKQMEEPSLVWETTVAPPEPEPEGDLEDESDPQTPASASSTEVIDHVEEPSDSGEVASADHDQVGEETE